MRRADREIKDFNKVVEFIAAEDVLRLALTDSDGTYIVPVNYGFELLESQGAKKLCFYFHGAGEGRKAAALKVAAQAGTAIPFEIDGQHSAVVADGCDASYCFMSVIGNATIELLEGDDKVHGLNTIMNCIMPADAYHYDDSVVAITTVVRLTVQDWSCKKH